ncbi:MAG: SCP2 sterol-binding domain-containing protein [Burkholderiales bacterium]|nr:SCP2 sterol-binding domain-containing protein [Burkholderiales bacterium]
MSPSRPSLPSWLPRLPLPPLPPFLRPGAGAHSPAGAGAASQPSGAPVPLAWPVPPALADALRPLLSRLPRRPPQWAACALLNRLWWPRVDAQAQQALCGKVVEVQVDDFGLCVRLIAHPGRGLQPAPAAMPATLRLRARAEVYWRLLQGQDDPDTLFFERALVMEGDTDFGLQLKNTLDAVGPIWAPAGRG